MVEWAVKMQRLPDDATLENRLRRGEVTPEQMEALAHKIAGFHASAQRSEHIASFGRFDVVAENIRENYRFAASHVGQTLSAEVLERLKQRTEEVLAKLRPLIDARARRGVPCDTHGDLHLDHVYLLTDSLSPSSSSLAPSPSPLLIIDCIEFNERYRYADPVADMAFLAMDLIFHGRRDLARTFQEAYFEASGDAEGRSLAPLYVSYRAAVRGKVDGIKQAEAEIEAAERDAARGRAHAYWLLALGELEEPSRRPALVLIGGLPGSGKSTLARGLAERAGFTVLRSDVVRKELAGLAASDPVKGEFDSGIYDAKWTERTYAELRRRAEEVLWRGGRVIIDASFRQEANRRLFLEAAQDWGVPALLLECRAEDAVIRERLQGRRGDASDADWSIYQQAAAAWEPTKAPLHVLDTNLQPAMVFSAAQAILRDAGLT